MERGLAMEKSTVPAPFIGEEVERISFEDGSWVDIKSQMSVGDWESLEKDVWNLQVQPSASNRAQRRQAAKDGVQVDTPIKASWNPSNVALLKLNIVSWYWDRLVTLENIRRMHPYFASRIMEEIERRNPENPLVR